MKYPYSHIREWTRVVADLCSGSLQFFKWLGLPDTWQESRTVPDDYFGVNVATSEDPACDDYIIEALSELGIRQICIHFTYESMHGNAARLLERALAEGMEVMLKVFPPLEDAKKMAYCADSHARWRQFVVRAGQRYGARLGAVEIGSTPNRGRWSGFDAPGSMRTWEIAVEALKDTEVVLAGPNVSDFEPLYNFGLLKGMARHQVPGIHTDNLFVERVMQPEIFDHRALGTSLKSVARLNLVKKANVLTHISGEMGVPQSMCTYACWTRRRLQRLSANPDRSHANYLIRYLVITAAASKLDRVYWGPLICHRDGLIDDNDKSYPRIDQVSHYQSVRGQVSAFRKTAAFAAFAHINKLLAGATFTHGHTMPEGINHFVCSKAGQTHHILWCADRRAYPLANLYTREDLDTTKAFNGAGVPLNDLPLCVSEAPVILSWPAERLVAVPDTRAFTDAHRYLREDVVHNLDPSHQSIHIDTSDWRGAMNVPVGGDSATLLNQLVPSALTKFPVTRVLRDKRNRLWNVQLDPDSGHEQTVKLNRARGLKKFTYRFLPSKGRRHWNNATEMLRRGINTPRPIAFMERVKDSSVRDNYYVSEYIPHAFSARDVFTAFKQGEQSYRGLSKEDWLTQIAQFIAEAHSKGVFHRDLSSGNLLFTQQSELTLYFIDIGRASMPRRKTVANRMRDLNRICFKLDQHDRETLLVAYQTAAGKKLPAWSKIWLSAYDAKQSSKRAVKGKLRRRL